jgi:hypothetical protein
MFLEKAVSYWFPRYVGAVSFPKVIKSVGRQKPMANTLIANSQKPIANSSSPMPKKA